MSMIRPIWNDGQGLTTPDLQRPCDTVGGADDRAHEVLLTPGSVQKKVLPLTEENAAGSANGFTGNPRLLAVPSTSSLTPAGVNGAVRVMPFSFVAGTAANTQQISLTGNTFTTLDTTAIGSNNSGSNRYDLVYATLTRQVSASASRRIKSAVDGSVSSQTINLADAPTITLNINAGFLTGATAPTNAQILAALPADTTTSFSVAICYVTVANLYSSGTTLFQNSSGGTTFITQCWPGGWIQPHRIRGTKLASLYASAQAEKPTSVITDRWGSDNRLFVHFKLLPASGNTVSTGVILDQSIDWRRRLILIHVCYLGTAVHLTQIEQGTLANGQSGTSSPVANFGQYVPLFLWPGAAAAGDTPQIISYDVSVSGSMTLAVEAATGYLRAYRNTLKDAVNGDAYALMLQFSDQFSF